MGTGRRPAPELALCLLFGLRRCATGSRRFPLRLVLFFFAPAAAPKLLDTSSAS